VRTRAGRVGAGWRLTGQKVWTSLAHEADWAICLARTDPTARKHEGITFVLVDMHAPGIDIRPLREITGRTMFSERAGFHVACAHAVALLAERGTHPAIRKLLGTGHRQAVAETALELLGPAGAADGEASYEFLFTRCLSIAGGTTQILLTQVAERVLGLPR
jgi:alkylation response protein AidB-like acyl-CoA dehydrogenase